MKISNFSKNEITDRLEEFAKKLNQTAQQVVIQDPVAFADQIRRKGSELLAILKSSLFKGRARVSRPEFLRAQIKKKVIENLDESIQYPEVIDEVVNTLVQAAKEDPHYRKLLGIE
ncbi:MAG: hypothetical protein U1F57_11710 [bacterium]